MNIAIDKFWEPEIIKHYFTLLHFVKKKKNLTCVYYWKFKPWPSIGSMQTFSHTVSCLVNLYLVAIQTWRENGYEALINLNNQPKRTPAYKYLDVCLQFGDAALGAETEGSINATSKCNNWQQSGLFYAMCAYTVDNDSHCISQDSLFVLNMHIIISFCSSYPCTEVHLRCLFFFYC